MKKFNLVNALTLDEGVSVLQQNKGNSKILAGGSDLLGAMLDRINPTYPEVLVNFKSVPGMDYIEEEAGMLRIGAMTLLEDVANNAVVQNKYQALSQAARSVGTPQLRNVGTLGGNLCQETRCWYYRVSNNRFYCFKKGGTLCFAMVGDNRYNAILGGQVCFAVCPSDTAIALSALDATVVTNKRNMPIGELYQVLQLVLDEDEVITEIQVPEPEAGTKQVFSKFRLRKAIDFAISSVAVAINSDGGTVSDARIVLGGVAPVPYRAVDAEDAIKGNVINESIAESAGENAVKGAVPLSKNKYLIPITKALVKRAVLA